MDLQEFHIVPIFNKVAISPITVIPVGPVPVKTGSWNSDVHKNTKMPDQGSYDAEAFFWLFKRASYH